MRRVRRDRFGHRPAKLFAAIERDPGELVGSTGREPRTVPDDLPEIGHGRVFVFRTFELVDFCAELKSPAGERRYRVIFARCERGKVQDRECIRGRAQAEFRVLAGRASRPGCAGQGLRLCKPINSLMA